MPLILALLMGCSGDMSSNTALFARALSEQTPTDQAVRTCGRISDRAQADECLATLAHSRRDLPLDACAAIVDERWAGECAFAQAERRAQEGDRWAALQVCGKAGPFYDECLYHLWTIELVAAARAAPDAGAAVAEGRRVVAFWKGIQTVGTQPEALLWSDFWFFAHNEHRPADFAACRGIDDQDERSSCDRGTETFVLRALVGAMLAPGVQPDLLDRICRSGQFPDVMLAGLFVPDPRFDAQVQRAAELACDAAAGKPVRRWNPIFSERAPRW